MKDGCSNAKQCAILSALFFVGVYMGTFLLVAANRGAEVATKTLLFMLVSTGPIVVATVPISALYELFLSFFMKQNFRKALVVGTAVIVLGVFAVSYLVAVTVPILKYVAETSVRGVVTINATATVIPVRGGYNITYTIVITNRNPYPINVTAVQSILGLFSFKRIDTPGVTVEPNGSTAITLHTTNRYPVDSGYHRLAVYVVRADIHPIMLLGLTIDPLETVVEMPIEVQMYN